MKTSNFLFCLCLSTLLAVASTNLVSADDSLIAYDPSAVGLDADDAARLRGAMQAAVDAKKISGAILLVADEKGEGLYQTIGVQGSNDATAMNEKTIFRIYSMTKPVISVATMMLIEEGSMALSDPVSKYIPEYANLSVIDEATGKTRPTNTEMTVEHLLTHESGLIYGVFDKGSALGKSYTEAGISSYDITALELAKRLARLPLRFDPGTAWHYGRSTDVLGAVLEVASGKPLDQLLKEKLFDPLGMMDTSFYVPPEKAHRLAEPVHGKLSTPRINKKMFSGGSGLNSTTEDYARFGSMLINKGQYGGVRIIKSETLKLMTSAFIGNKVSREHFFYKDKGDFGLGFGLIPVDPEKPDSLYTYGWGGYAGTEFWVDPVNGFFVVYMIQAHGVPGGVGFKPRKAIYGALGD